MESATQSTVQTLNKSNPPSDPGGLYHHRGMLDPNKTRFVRANSAVAFPRILGMAFESDSIPRLHSFGWHLGLRAQPQLAQIDITALLTWADMQRLAQTYFSIVKPQIGLLEEGLFWERISARFAAPTGHNDLDAVALGVAALGSYFSEDAHALETEFASHAKTLLISKSMDISPSLDDVAAWILRTLYLRLTQRPHASWLASMITMHQIESSGLHKELQTIAVVYPATSQTARNSKVRRRLFWVARALNVLIAFDFGRTRRLRSNIDIVTTKRFAPEAGSSAHLLVDLAEYLPDDNGAKDGQTDPHLSFETPLKNIQELQTESDFLLLMKAEVVFGIYRRVWLMSVTDVKERSDIVMSIGEAGLAAAERLLRSKTPWWGILHVPFQFICVLLAVSTPKSLSLISRAMTLLREIAQIYDTHVSREAYSQAIILVQMSRKRKAREIEALDALPTAPPFENQTSPLTTPASATANVNWTLDMPFDFDMFLNPDLVMSHAQGPLVGDDELNGFTGF